jgi:ankyrin repeat protein
MIADFKKGIDNYRLNAILTKYILEHRLNTNGMRLTPLFAIAFNSNYKLTYKLLKDSVKHQASNIGSFTALHYAAILLDLSLISRLLKANRPDFEAFYKHLKYSIRT